MAYHATKQRVLNRGVPPDNFLDELVAWGRSAPDEIFVPNSQTDIYSNVFGVLGPWEDLRHRRAAMLSPRTIAINPGWPGGANPKFASFCGTLVCELRNRRALATL